MCKLHQKMCNIHTFFNKLHKNSVDIILFNPKVDAYKLSKMVKENFLARNFLRFFLFQGYIHEEGRGKINFKYIFEYIVEVDEYIQN